MMGLFGKDKKADTKEQVRELQRKMRSEMRQLDRQIRGIEREEMKVCVALFSTLFFCSKFSDL